MRNCYDIIWKLINREQTKKELLKEEIINIIIVKMLDEEENEQNDMNDNEALDEGDAVEDNNEENEVIDENDSNSDNRFPEVNEGGWIQWFVHLKGNEFFCEVDEDFIRNKANLIGIKCDEYIDTLLSPEAPNEATLNEEYLENLPNIKDVYGLIFKRFIMTPKGLALMREKYLNGEFGQCPRVLCDKQVLIPVGLSEDLKYSRVKVYCPICEEVYKSKMKGSDIDGGYFGTSFPQVLLMAYPDLNPKHHEYKNYIPKIYGFKVFGKRGSKYYCKDKKELYEKMKLLNISLDY